MDISIDFIYSAAASSAVLLGLQLLRKWKHETQMRTCCDKKLRCNIVGVGCWSMGASVGDTYWGERTQETTNAIVAKALSYGTMFFDTAEVYNNGASEKALGVALKAAGAKAMARAMIASKISPQNCHDVRDHLEATLARLQVKSIYLYQIHWPLNEMTCCHTSKSAFHNQEAAKGGVPDIENVFGVLEALRKEGKITHIGVSNFGVRQLKEALATGVTIATNQVCYNYGSRMIEYEVMPLCIKHNIGIIAYSPLMQGVLTDKGVASKSFDEFNVNRCRTRHFKGTRQNSRHKGPGAEAELRAALNVLGTQAAAVGRPAHVVAMQWLLQQPGVVSVIPGARTVEMLDSNIAVANLRPLSREVMAVLDKGSDALKIKMGTKIDVFESNEGQRSL